MRIVGRVQIFGRGQAQDPEAISDKHVDSISKEQPKMFAGPSIDGDVVM